MKIDSRSLASFLRQPDPRMRAILIHGPDEGLVRERGEALARTAVPDLGDPFRVAEFAGAALKDDPAKLADEAAAIAFGGGRRVVRVRPAGNESAAALASFLAHPVGDALVILEAGELEARGALRKLAEGADNAAVIGCYHDEGKALDAVITQQLAARGVKAERAALDWLAAHLGGDRLVTRAEIDKLALYAGKGATITLADARAAIGDSAEIGLDDLVHAIAEGDVAAADRALTKLASEGAQPVQIIRALSRHVMRLLQLTGLMEAGRDARGAIAALRPPVFWKDPPRLERQLRRWSRDQLARALDDLIRVELRCKTSGQPAELLAARAVLALSQQQPIP